MGSTRSSKRGRKRPVDELLADVSSAVTDLRSDFENEKSQTSKLLEETLGELRACVRSLRVSSLPLRVATPQ